MKSDLVIQRALQDVHDLLLAKNAGARDLSDERTVLCVRVLVGKDDVKQALEKANDTAVCFALREVKHVLDQRQRPKPTINHLRRIIEQTGLYNQQNPQMIPWWKKPPTR